MRAARSARWLWAASRSTQPRVNATRCIHSSSQRQAEKPLPPSTSSPKQLEKGRDGKDHTERDVEVRTTLNNLKKHKYTPEERAQLEKKYNAEQMAALDAAEEAIDLGDLARQGVLRKDPMALNYIDDLSKIDPVIDKKPQPKTVHYDPNLRFKDSDEFAEDWAEFIENMPENPDRVEVDKFLDNVRMTVGKPEAELEADYTAPELPKLTDPVVRQQAKHSDEGTDEWAPLYARLSKQVGMKPEELQVLRIKQMVYHRVANQTRMGKIHSDYFLTVCGNGRGMLGIGEGKAAEAEAARKQSILNAMRNMTYIPRYEKRTIFGDVKGKSGATELTLYTRPPGFGLRAQAKIYEMCKCAGISDIAARVTRSRNPMNTIKAAFKALTSQRDPEEIAKARGKKLVDVRKVYYAGNV